MRALFLDGADVVLAAIGDERVVAAWDEPSVLDDQTIGGLAGHLARGSVWVVADYLDRPAPTGAVSVETAAEYFAHAADQLTSDDHVAIRERGAEIAADGPQGVLRQLAESIDDLRDRLPAEASGRTLAVYGEAIMRLDDYLLTRIVEQVVHLDDLARSVGAEPWPTPPEAEELVVACGAEIARRRHGGTSIIRALYRADQFSFPGVF